MLLRRSRVAHAASLGTRPGGPGYRATTWLTPRLPSRSERVPVRCHREQGRGALRAPQAKRPSPLSKADHAATPNFKAGRLPVLWGAQRATGKTHAASQGTQAASHGLAPNPPPTSSQTTLRNALSKANRRALPTHTRPPEPARPHAPLQMKMLRAASRAAPAHSLLCTQRPPL